VKYSLTGIFFLFSTFLFGQNTILWKVTNPTNKNISYLLGTYHLFGESFVDSFFVIKDKLQETDIVITETKIDRAKVYAYYNARASSDTLSTVLSKENFDFIINRFKKRKSQVDVTKLTPGELFVSLQAGYPKFKCVAINQADTFAMDEYVQYLGNLNKKRLYYFETDSLQLEKIAQATSVYDWKFLKKNMPSLIDKYRNDKSDENLCSLANQYASLAIDYKFEEKCNFFKGDNMNEVLVKKRNTDWLPKLKILLENNNCFIAIGLGHFYNKCGLIQQLREIGYIIEPVKMK
jgi:uncharacterized protein YbaP (TraB family)